MRSHGYQHIIIYPHTLCHDVTQYISFSKKIIFVRQCSSSRFVILDRMNACVITIYINLFYYPRGQLYFDLHWTENANLAFTESKQILANATLLVHPNPLAPLNITCDTGDFPVGGVLQQCIDGVWQPLSFFSKKLAPAETRYSAFDRELLEQLDISDTT